MIDGGHAALTILVAKDASTHELILALEQLDECINTWSPADLTSLCSSLRDGGGCEVLVEMLGSGKDCMQPALLLLSNVASSSIDPISAHDTRERLLVSCAILDA